MLADYTEESWVQAKGKSLQVYLEPAEIEPLLEEIKPEGLMLRTWASSETEAHEVIRKVERITC